MPAMIQSLFLDHTKAPRAVQSCAASQSMAVELVTAKVTGADALNNGANRVCHEPLVGGMARNGQ
jgi:hypothetical protein